MAMKCANCGKGVMIGHNVSHAKNRTRKVFKPNLHAARMVIGGTSRRVKLCTKCLRELRGRNTRSRKAISSAAPVAAGLA
jgi:large subunit ribosomal protein L28